MNRSTEHPPLPSGRIASLDFLRGLAILYVVALLHPQDYISFKYLAHRVFDVSTAACLGVFVFISGYLLEINNRCITGVGGIKRYIKKRFLRIYPLYLLALVVFMLFSFISWKALLLNGLFVNMVINKSMPTLWFVSMICCYYLFFPVVAVNYGFYRTILLTAGLYCLLAAVHFLTGLIDVRLVTYLPIFSFGVLAANEGWVEGLFQRPSVLLGTFAAFGALAFAFLLTSEGSASSLLTRTAFTACVIPFMTALGAAGANIVGLDITSRVAYASFCMYLFHRVVFHILTEAWHLGNDAATILYLLLVGLPVLYGVSFYFQRWYDRQAARFA